MLKNKAAAAYQASVINNQLKKSEAVAG